MYEALNVHVIAVYCNHRFKRFLAVILLKTFQSVLKPNAQIRELTRAHSDRLLLRHFMQVFLICHVRINKAWLVQWHWWRAKLHRLACLLGCARALDATLRVIKSFLLCYATLIWGEIAFFICHLEGYPSDANLRGVCYD